MTIFKKAKYQITVEQDEYKYTSKLNTTLTTEGISGCIAFLVRGKIQKNGKSFCGLYHWSGFHPGIVSEFDQRFNIEINLHYFFSKLRKYLKLHTDTLELTQLIFLGGERKTEKISGTEREVSALRYVIENLDFSSLNIIVSSDCIENHHFLTKEDSCESISAEIDIHGIRYRIDEREWIELNPSTDESINLSNLNQQLL